MRAPSLVLIVGLAVAVLVSACTADTTDRGTGIWPSGGAGPSSRASRPAAPVDIPYAEGMERKAKSYRELRAIDPCALLDPAAAARVTHDRADSLLPDEHFGACRLDVSKSRWELTWQFSVEIGEKYDPDSELELGQATPETIKGVEFYREKSSFDKERCTYVRPIEKGYSITLTASAGFTTPSMAACDVASQYLAQTAARWRQLPRRSDTLTEPRLPLADRDPCEVTTAVRKALDRPVRARPTNPYECVLVADPTENPSSDPSGEPGGGAGADPGGDSSAPMPGGADIHITYTLDRDPAARPASTSIVSITVEGRAATQSQLEGLGCTVEVAVYQDNDRDNDRDDDRVVVQGEDNSEYVEIVSIRAPSCQDATSVATAVIKHLT